MKPKITVMIPVFNTEPYLRECLDSILAQTLREIEVICVDDASTDGSPAILAEYAKRDSRVRVFTNSANLQSGGCRNIGLDAAQGDFVYYVDSDDLLLEPCMLEELVSLAERERLDLVMFSAKNIFDGSLPEDEKVDLPLIDDAICGKTITGGELLDLTRKHLCYNCYLWTRIFRTDTIRREGIRFMEGTSHDDSLFSPLATVLASRARAVNHVYYAHRIHPGSVMQSVRADPAFVSQRFDIEKRILEEFLSTPVQAKVAGSESHSVNELAAGFLRRMGTLFAQMSDEEAEQSLAGFGYDAIGRIAAMHLRATRAFSRKLVALDKRLGWANKKLAKAKQRIASSAERLKKTKQQLASSDKRLKKTEKRMRQMRDKRPNSIRSCIAFILRRIAVKAGLRRADG